MRCRKISVCFWLLLESAVLCLADDIRIFESSSSWENPENIRLHEQDMLFNDPYTRDYQGRSISFNFYFDDGTLFLLNIFQWLYSFFKGWGIAVLVVQPDGEKFVYEGKIPDAGMVVASDRLFVSFGDSILEGADGEYRLRLSLEGFQCDLHIVNIIPAWRPGDGYVVLTPEATVYTRFAVANPWARVRGTLSLNQRTIPVEGQCYGDRTLHKYPLRRLNNPLYYFRVFNPEAIPWERRWLLNMVVYQTHSSYGGKKVQILTLAQGGKWLFTTRSYSVSLADFIESEKAPYPYPTRFVLRAEDRGRLLEGEFVSMDLYHISDVFEKLPLFLRPIALLFFKRPVVFRLRGTFHGRLTYPDGHSETLSLYGPAEYSVAE